ncbi:MAG: purine-nucleoside phosphorylase [Clostridiales bacterium]|jgi:purine-nucleoside phosphorylase|nr:purine-nucleoside phosphorylase [Clostridiales bacterium]
MTPHIEAKKGDIAKTVIMPGDPLRAKFIAENFLEEAVQFNGVRGMLGYTGRYKGAELSVMGSGMGIPSMGIYAYELFSFYDVDAIIRVGTAGGIADGLALRDIVIAMGASTNSAFMGQYCLAGQFAPLADFGLLSNAVKYAEAAGVACKVGNVLTSDTFYGDDKGAMEGWRKMGVLAVEMEAAGLYATAARLGKKALTILTISDMVFTHEATSAQERQESFTKMMEIALDSAANSTTG